MAVGLTPKDIEGLFVSLRVALRDRLDVTVLPFRPRRDGIEVEAVVPDAGGESWTARLVLDVATGDWSAREFIGHVRKHGAVRFLNKAPDDMSALAVEQAVELLSSITDPAAPDSPEPGFKDSDPAAVTEKAAVAARAVEDIRRESAAERRSHLALACAASLLRFREGASVARDAGVHDNGGLRVVVDAVGESHGSTWRTSFEYSPATSEWIADSVVATGGWTLRSGSSGPTLKVAADFADLRDDLGRATAKIGFLRDAELEIASSGLGSASDTAKASQVAQTPLARAIRGLAKGAEATREIERFAASEDSQTLFALMLKAAAMTAGEVVLGLAAGHETAFIGLAVGSVGIVASTFSRLIATQHLRDRLCEIAGMEVASSSAVEAATRIKEMASSVFREPEPSVDEDDFEYADAYGR